MKNGRLLAGALALLAAGCKASSGAPPHADAEGAQDGMPVSDSGSDGEAHAMPDVAPHDAGTDAPADAGAGTADADAAPTSGGGARFVAVGYGNRRIWSDDGKTWTEAPFITNPPWSPNTPLQPTDGDNEWLLRGVCYGNGRFLAVGGNGAMGMTATSTDGRTWQVGANQSNDGCAYGNGVFTTGRRFSVDGLGWTNATVPSVALREILFGGGRFVAVGDQSGGNVSVSTDGKTWMELPIAFTSPGSSAAGYTNVAYGLGHYYAVKSCCGRTDYKFFEWDGQSSTSFTESSLSAIVGTDAPEGISAGGGRLILYGPGYYYERLDGSSTWTRHQTPTLAGGEDRPLQFVQYFAGLYVSPGAWTPDLTNFTAAVLTNHLWPAGSDPALVRMAVRP